MNKYIAIFLCFLVVSCGQKQHSGSFVVEGTLDNAADQKVFLEQIYFNQTPPSIIDTAEMKDGKFEIGANASEQGLYRIRFEKNAGYLFINDEDDIRFHADAKDQTLKSTRFNTPANSSLTQLIIQLDSIHTQLIAQDQQRVDASKEPANDSVRQMVGAQFDASNKRYQQYLVDYIDSTSSPVIAIFALSYAQEVNSDTLKNIVTRLSQKFPSNTSVASVVKQFADFEAASQAAPASGEVTIGQVAPDFTLPDVNGKPFTLSSLRGKYVLIDFWASWCAPCREENPNVVANYNRFKNKNFTILGVSLDKDKAAWLKAIENDGLAWKQVSDLKFWNSEAAALYGVQGIPYNVLVDTEGKVVATNLRGADLSNKLSELFR